MIEVLAQATFAAIKSGYIATLTPKQRVEASWREKNRLDRQAENEQKVKIKKRQARRKRWFRFI